jgi:hypothetical protein
MQDCVTNLAFIVAIIFCFSIMCFDEIMQVVIRELIKVFRALLEVAQSQQISTRSFGRRQVCENKSRARRNLYIRPDQTMITRI